MTDEGTKPRHPAVEWWQEYCHPENGDRATRARLRRCKDARDAMMVPAALVLAQRLGRIDGHPDRIEDALNLACVLAHVKENSATSLMQSCGFSRPPRRGEASPEQPRLATIRFNRLMRSDRGELPRSLIRLVMLLDGKASIEGLSDALLNWGHPHQGDRVRRSWAFDYYGARQSIPETNLTDTEGTSQ